MKKAKKENPFSGIRGVWHINPVTRCKGDDKKELNKKVCRKNVTRNYKLD